MAQRVSGSGTGMRTRKKTFVAKAPSEGVETTPQTRDALRYALMGFTRQWPYSRKNN